MSHLWGASGAIRGGSSSLVRSAGKRSDHRYVHFFAYAITYDSHRAVVIGHRRKGVTVVLIDRPATETTAGRRRPDSAETWLYDAAGNIWSRAPGAELPFPCGMNCNLHYDAVHDLLQLVAEEPTAIWALRLL